MKRWPVIRHIRWALAWLDVALMLYSIGAYLWESWLPGDLDKVRDIRRGLD